MTRKAQAEKELIVNGEARRSGSGTVEDLIGELGLSERRVAVLVNGGIVRRKQFAVKELSDGDEVEIISLIGGG